MIKNDDKDGSISGLGYAYEEEYETTEEDVIIYDKENEIEELKKLYNKGVMTTEVDTEQEKVPEQIDQENIPQPSRRSKRHIAPDHILEPTMIGKTYQNNHLIIQTVE